MSTLAEVAQKDRLEASEAISGNSPTIAESGGAEGSAPEVRARAKDRGGARVPALLKHKRSGRAFVVLNGKQHYVGAWGTPEARKKYLLLVQEWEARGRRLHETSVRVADLADDFLGHCELYYRRRDGSSTGETLNVADSLGQLLELYAETPVEQFGIEHLLTVRNRMIQADLARGTINSRIGRIVRMFRWGVENLKVPAHVHGALRSVAPLPAGRSAARETEAREPVEEADVRKALEHLPTAVRALVLTMWHTAMRCGEAVQLRTRDVDMTGEVWLFRPGHHKTQHRGKDRVIPIGKAAQEVLRPFVHLDPDRYWFRPIEADLESRARRRKNRKTPLYPSHVRAILRKRKRVPKKSPRDCYDTRSVAAVIRRACDEAGLEQHWSPHQLRYAALTRITKKYGLEAAQAIGGHSRMTTTRGYTRQAESALALRVMGEIG